MSIQSPCVVSLVWTLSDSQGKTIDELTSPMEFLVGGEDLLPKVEEALLGQAVGFETQLHLEPEHAFGEYDSDLVCFEPRSLFPAEIEVGMQLEGLPEGHITPHMPAETLYTITDIYPEHVVLDGNHPLAGIALRLQLKVTAVRPASEAEVEAGTVGGSLVQLGSPVDVDHDLEDDDADDGEGRTLH